MNFLFNNLIFIILAIVGIVYGINYWLENSRKQALKTWASENGLDHLPFLKPDTHDLLYRFAIAQKGRSRLATNSIVADTEQVGMSVFDYVYITGSGKNQSSHRFSIALISSDSIIAPALELQPQLWYSSFTKMFGGMDIDFEDDPEFSNAFVIRGIDPPSIKDFLTPTRRKALMPFRQLTIEVQPKAVLIAWRKRLRAKDIPGYMATALQVYDAIATPKSA